MSVMPFFDRQLTGSQCRAGAVPVFQDLQQVTTMLCCQFGKSPVIEYQDIRFGERGQEFGVTPITLGDGHLLQQSGQPQVQGVYPSRQAFCASAQASQVLPTPVGPVSRMLRCSLTHWQAASDWIRDLSSPLGWR